MEEETRIQCLERARNQYHTMFGGLNTFKDIMTFEELVYMKEADRLLRSIFVNVRRRLDEEE